MIYGYIRISTGKQNQENQEYEIRKFAEQNHIVIDDWITETISGTKNPDKRKLGKLLNIVQPGDVIIATEISRFGRSLYMIMDILQFCMEKECKIMTIKDNFRLQDDIQSKVLAFAFGLAAEIERNLISQRTKEALETRKANGVQLGRPKGSRSKCTKLSGKEEGIKILIEQKVPISQISKIFKVDRGTVVRFLERMKEDGMMAKRGDRFLSEFSTKHNLKILYVSDLIQYRLKFEKLTTIISQEEVEFFDTKATKIKIKDHLNQIHSIFKFGNPTQKPLVKFHTIKEDLELLENTISFKGLMRSIEILKKEGGYLVFLKTKTNKDIKELGIGAQILKSFEIEDFRLLTTSNFDENECSMLSGFNLKILERIEA